MISAFRCHMKLNYGFVISHHDNYYYKQNSSNGKFSQIIIPSTLPTVMSHSGSRGVNNTFSAGSIILNEICEKALTIVPYFNEYFIHSLSNTEVTFDCN
jgi:hypothetical protein